MRVGIIRRTKRRRNLQSRVLSFLSHYTQSYSEKLWALSIYLKLNFNFSQRSGPDYRYLYMPYLRLQTGRAMCLWSVQSLILPGLQIGAELQISMGHERSLGFADNRSISVGELIYWAHIRNSWVGKRLSLADRRSVLEPQVSTLNRGYLCRTIDIYMAAPLSSYAKLQPHNPDYSYSRSWPSPHMVGSQSLIPAQDRLQPVVGPVLTSRIDGLPRFKITSHPRGSIACIHHPRKPLRRNPTIPRQRTPLTHPLNGQCTTCQQKPLQTLDSNSITVLNKSAM